MCETSDFACLWNQLHLSGYLQRATGLLKWLNCFFFSSFPSKLACTQKPQTAIWSLLFLHPRWSLFSWAIQRSLGEQEKASLEVTCLVWRLPALGRTQGRRWLEDCGAGRSRSHIHVVLAGRDAPHRGRLGSFQGVTVQKQGRVNKCLLLEQENLWNGDVEWHSLTPVQESRTH